jgi:hypothetical protein
MTLAQVPGDIWDLALDFQQPDHIFNFQIAVEPMFLSPLLRLHRLSWDIPISILQSPIVRLGPYRWASSLKIRFERVQSTIDILNCFHDWQTNQSCRKEPPTAEKTYQQTFPRGLSSLFASNMDPPISTTQDRNPDQREIRGAMKTVRCPSFPQKTFQVLKCAPTSNW